MYFINNMQRLADRRSKYKTPSHSQSKKPMEKKSRGPGGDLHGTLSPDPQKSRFEDVTGWGSLFPLHLSVD